MCPCLCPAAVAGNSPSPAGQPGQAEAGRLVPPCPYWAFHLAEARPWQADPGHTGGCPGHVYPHYAGQKRMAERGDMCCRWGRLRKWSEVKPNSEVKPFLKSTSKVSDTNRQPIPNSIANLHWAVREESAKSQMVGWKWSAKSQMVGWKCAKQV